MSIENKSALTAFGIAFCGAMLATIVVTNGKAILDPVAWVTSGLTGGLSLFKDLRSSYRLPPVDGDALTIKKQNDNIP